MSTTSLIELDEDELDYEIDDMEVDEEALLEEDTEGKQNEITSQMSSATFTLVTPTEPLPNDNWQKTESTIFNVLQHSPTKPTDEAVEPNDTIIDRKHQIVSKIKDIMTTTMPIEEVIHESGQNDGTKTEVMRIDLLEQTNIASVPKRKIISFDVVDSASVDSVKMNPPDGHTITSSISSTESSIKRRSSYNDLQNNSLQFHHRNGSLQSLMSIDTTGVAEHLNIKPKIRPLRNKPVQLQAWKPAEIPAPIEKVPFIIDARSTPWKPTENTPVQNSTARPIPNKVPFTIQAHVNGQASSRTIVANPLFAGFSNQNPNGSMTVRKRERPIYEDESRTAKLCKGDLRNVVINKRRSITLIASIAKSEEKMEVAMSIACEEMNDEDKKYLMLIEQQRLKREDVIRQKEWKRQNEGWQFPD